MSAPSTDFVWGPERAAQVSALRIGNCSGFFGDRLSAAREMIDGGPIDVLTGDWLAELTMGVLTRQRRRDPSAGYARTFVHQMEDVLGECLDRGIKVISNAGGLNPHECAAAVAGVALELGRTVCVAVVDGDDITGLFGHLREHGWSAPHLDTGEPLGGAEPEVVNAYLGGWGIAQALAAGADVVVTGRVTDASLILGPAAWHHGWARNDWDALAGAVAAGHIIECGAQATGGNYAFFTEIAGLNRAGFPIAEVLPDGSAIITKHPDTGGAVTIETVTAQLLYEIDGPRYLNPDVVCRLDTVELEQVGPDRVRVHGVRGEPPPETVKIGAILQGGWRNELTFVLTGGGIEAKADLVQEALWAAVPGGQKAFEEVTIRMVRADRLDPATMDEAVAMLSITVLGKDRESVSSFPRHAVELGLATYPGLYLTAPPRAATEVSVFWPTLLPASDLSQHVTIGGRTWNVELTHPEPADEVPHVPAPAEIQSSGPTVRRPIGVILGARSGDKAGNATLGVWARNDAAHRWLRSWWNTERLHELLPETHGHDLRLWELPQLRACGVTIIGFLGRGVAANPNLDSQAKGLAEYLRAKHVDIPIALLDAAALIEDGGVSAAPGMRGHPA